LSTGLNKSRKPWLYLQGEFESIEGLSARVRAEELESGRVWREGYGKDVQTSFVVFQDAIIISLPGKIFHRHLEVSKP
jgi:hypothetical protein